MSQFKIGDRVILGKHKVVDGVPVHWNISMEQYVGKIATIVSKFPSELYGSSCWYVDIDGGKFFWMKDVMRALIFNAEQKCSICNTSAPHVEAGNYVCPFCKVIGELK